MSSTVAILDQVRELYERGQYLQAQQAGNELGPIPEWQGVAGRLLAGRLAARLGAPRLSGALWYLAWRADPIDLSAQFCHAHAKVQRGRLLAAWKFLTSQEKIEQADGDPVSLSNWFLLHAEVLSQFRDFQRADQWLRKAEAIAPDDPWLWCVRARVLAAEDLHDDALAAAKRAVDLGPTYVPAVQEAAYRLMQSNRDEEALGLLMRATGELESGDVILQLASLHSELGEHEQAWECYGHVKSHYPLLEPAMAQMLAARRSDAAYHCGRMDEAVEYARQAQTPFHAVILPRLESVSEGKRVLLPVTFVQQHHLTCVPATLAAVSAYWSIAAEHLEIAEAICYDGTPAHSERRWAESNGFHVRECRLDWETCLALIDRRIPVLLETTAPGGGHMQAIVGYDIVRGTLIVRDPSQREYSEFLAEPLFEALASSGPRGMIMVPADQSALLNGMALPESDLYDKHYELESVLAVHDRYRAQAAMDALGEMAPDERLTLRAQCALCRYDADPIGLGRALDQLLTRFPGDLTLVMTKLGCLQEIGRLDDRLALLREFGEGRSAHPALLLNYARELSHDARYAENAKQLVRQVIRHEPQNGAAYSILADIVWHQQVRREATLLYRFAACLSDTDEQAATQYFQAARAIKQTGEAIELLKDRFTRFGHQSANPACTLSSAYRELAQDSEAVAVLQSAEDLRPDDPDLLIFAAQQHALAGNQDRARELLLRAKPMAAKTRWLRAAAELAGREAEPDAALARWREVVALEPLAADAHHMIAQLLVDTDGLEGAIVHLRTASRRHPRSFALRSLLLEWVKHESNEAVESIAREMLDFQPLACHARCSLALALLYQGRVAEAHEEVETALSFHPAEAEVHTVRGFLYAQIGDSATAKDAFRAAIRISADEPGPIEGLLDACASPEERREELCFLREELVKQTLFGNGLLIFRDRAGESLQPAAVLEVLREAHAARPDLWHAWSALIRQLLDMEQSAEALTVAEQASQRFPRRAQSWIDLALAHDAAGNRDEKTACLRRALQLDGESVFASCELANALQRDSDLDGARRILLEAIRRSPRSGRPHRELAVLLAVEGDRVAAQDRLAKAVRADPDDDAAWELLALWARQSDDPQWALDLAADLRPNTGVAIAETFVERNPEEIKWRLEQAGFFLQMDDAEASCQTLQQAIAIEPDDPAIYDRLAVCLASMGRYDEAMAACRPAIFGDRPPAMLRFRSADIVGFQDDRNTAIAEMQRLVGDEPDFLPAWTRLADWLSAPNPRSPDYLQAAENYARLAPDDSNAWANLGYARSARRQVAQAITAYSRAIELAPSNLFAGTSLFDHYLADDDAESASDVLEKLSPYLRYVDITAAQVRLSVTRGDEELAGEQFRELCRLGTADAQLLSTVAESFSGAGWWRELLELMDSEIDAGRAMPLVAQLWMDIVARRGRWKRCADKLRDWQHHHDIWPAAAVHYLYMLGEANNQRYLRKLLRRHRQALRADNRCWSQVGATYIRLEQYRRAARWTADWESREGLEASTLHQLAACLSDCGQDGDAAGVRRAALQLPADETWPYHAVSIALEEVLAGNLPGASELVANIDPRRLAGAAFYQALLAMVGALLPTGEAPDGTANQAPDHKARRCRLRQVSRAHPLIAQTPTLRRQYFRALCSLYQRANKPMRAAWYSLRLMLM